MRVTRRSFRRLLGTGALLAGLSAALLGPQTTHAQLSVCYGDPVIFLSNGAVLDLSSVIFTDSANVQNVTYTLTLPAGASVNSIYYPGNAAQFETVVPVSGTSANTYSVDTVVTASQPASVLVGEIGKVNGTFKATIGRGQTNNDILTNIQL